MADVAIVAVRCAVTIIPLFLLRILLLYVQFILLFITMILALIVDPLQHHHLHRRLH